MVLVGRPAGRVSHCQDLFFTRPWVFRGLVFMNCSNIECIYIEENENENLEMCDGTSSLRTNDTEID